MHNYLRAIGFSELKTKKELVEILQNLMNYKDSMDEHMYVKQDGNVLAEVKTYYGDGFGIIWSGYLVGEKEFELDHVIPFADGVHPMKEEQPSVERKKDIDSYIGICDDVRVGVSLIFQVQNSKDCERYLTEEINLEEPAVAFAGLSTSGRILLPIIKDENDKRQADQNRIELINAARKGDERAIETLTLEDIDTYSKLSKRIMYEDVFSIVDSSFMPYGLECDLYMIVCDIVAVEKTINILTKEELYNMEMSYNGFSFNVIINAKDLMGEPLPGRRFKGNIWLQGKIMDMATEE